MAGRPMSTQIFDPPREKPQPLPDHRIGFINVRDQSRNRRREGQEGVGIEEDGREAGWDKGMGSS